MLSPLSCGHGNIPGLWISPLEGQCLPPLKQFTMRLSPETRQRVTRFQGSLPSPISKTENFRIPKQARHSENDSTNDLSRFLCSVGLKEQGYVCKFE